MNNYNTDLLGIKDICMGSPKEFPNDFKISISTIPKPCRCPCCGKMVSRVHDYRLQTIKDLPFRNKPILLLLRKRRYRCDCGKRFFEKYSFLPRYHHMTGRVFESILNELRTNTSFKNVAARFSVSINTVTRVFDLVNYSLNKLPEVLAIDEFKGNTDNEKYQAILTNPQSHKLLDIMPTREKSALFDYFDSFNDRKHVKIFITDMWEPYKNLAKHFFPNAMIVVDKYHYVRQVYWALNGVRKRIQKRFVKDKRIYFKRSRWLLETDYAKLGDEDKQALSAMISQHTDLSDAWQLKEIFLEFQKCTSPSESEKLLKQFILTAEEVNLPEFKDAITAFHNWFPYIINSKRTPLTNAFTEGKNNKIKVLKRNAYGYRNFRRFRNRILHCG